MATPAGKDIPMTATPARASPALVRHESLPPTAGPAPKTPAIVLVTTGGTPGPGTPRSLAATPQSVRASGVAADRITIEVEPETDEEGSDDDSAASNYQETKANVVGGGAGSDVEAADNNQLRNVRVGVARDQCCGGSRRVLSFIAGCYTMRRLGFCAFVPIVIFIALLIVPLLTFIVALRQEKIFWNAAASIFILPLIEYVHGIWFYRKPYLMDLLDEVLASGEMFARAGERTVRRHIFLCFVLTPVLTVLLCISIFATDWLSIFFRNQDVAILRSLVIPFAAIAYFSILSPMMFASVFSVSVSLQGLKMAKFSEWVELFHPKAGEVIAAHHNTLRTLRSSVAHFRFTFTVTSIFNVVGVVVTFWTVAISNVFNANLIPFAIMLMVVGLLFQLYLLYIVLRASENNQKLKDSMLAYELRLPETSHDRLVIAIHNLSHQATFPIIGFTGRYTVDALIGIIFIGILGMLQAF